MMRSASSNSETFERWVMSPVWIMNEGFAGSALILLIASSSVPSALGLAGLSKPTWLSLICRKVSALAACGMASPTRPSERGTPPVTVHRTPVPAQVMHSSTLRRLKPSPSRLMEVSFLDVITALRLDLVAPTTRSDEAAVYSRPGMI